METLRQMPEVSTLEQISEKFAILAAIHKGEAAANAGQVTPHEEIRRKLSSGSSILDPERTQWTGLGLQSLAAAYGENEPEYAVTDLRP